MISKLEKDVDVCVVFSQKYVDIDFVFSLIFIVNDYFVGFE